MKIEKSEESLIIIVEAPKGKTGNFHLSEFFGNCPCPIGEIVELSINKRYNRKTGRAMHNQQIKYPPEVKNTESLNFILQLFQLCRKGHFLFFPCGLSTVKEIVQYLLIICKILILISRFAIHLFHNIQL